MKEDSKTLTKEELANLKHFLENNKQIKDINIPAIHTIDERSIENNNQFKGINIQDLEQEKDIGSKTR